MSSQPVGPVEVSISGTALNRLTGTTAAFALQFDIAGGELVTVGNCESALMKTSTLSTT